MKRRDEFDVLRVCALGLILLCHFLRSIGSHLLDIPLGCVGNMAFFTLSGILLGLGWAARGCPLYGLRFLRHRIVRLALPLWLFVIPWVFYLVMRGADVNFRGVAMNLLLLSWFDHGGCRVAGLTPYWFVTAIVVFYLVVVVLSRFAILRRVPVLVVGFCVLQMAFSFIGIQQSYLFVFLLAASVAFVKGDAILNAVSISARGGVCLLASVSLFGLLYALVLCDVLNVGTPSIYYATMPIVAAFSIGVVSLMRGRKASVLVGKVSEMSYEVYLVHSAVLGLVRPHCPSTAVYAVAFLALSLTLAYALHHLSKFVLNVLQAK